MLHNTKHFINNIRWLLTGTILSNIISIVITILIIRKLPVEDFGIYSLFLGSLMFFQILSANPILVLLNRYMPEVIQKQYFKYLKSLVLKLYLLSLLLGILLIITVSFFQVQIGNILNITKFPIYYSLFAINIFVFLLNSLNNSILVSLYEQKLIAIFEILSLITKGLLYAIFLPAITIELIFIIEASSMCVKAIPSSYIVFKKLNCLVGPETIEIPSFERRTNKKRMRRFTLLSFVNEMGYGILSEVSDYYFISAYLGPVALGLYAFPYKLLNSVFNWIPLNKLAGLIKPIFISKYYNSREDSIYLEKMFNLLFKIFLILYVIIVTFVIAYQEPVHLYLFNSKYVETKQLLVVIALFYLPASLLFPAGLIMEIKEQIQYLLYAKSLAILNIISVVCVLRFTHWGLIGVALSTGLSNLFKNLYIYFLMKRLTGIKLNIFELTKTAVTLAIFTTTVLALSTFESLTLRLLLPPGLGFLVLHITWRLIQPFNIEERETSIHFLNELHGRFSFITKILPLNS